MRLTPSQSPGASRPGRPSQLALVALLAKESAVLGLALFVLIDWTRLPSGQSPASGAGSVLRRSLGFLLAALAVTVVYFWVRQNVLGEASLAPLEFMGHRDNDAAGLAARLAACSRILGMYDRLLVFPHPLSADYSYDQVPLVASPLDWAGAGSVLLTGGSIALAFACHRRRPGVAFALLWLIAGLLPLAYGLPFFGIVLAERYLYLPSLGLCLLVGAAIAAVGRRQAFLGVALAIAVLAPATLGTVERNLDWRDDGTLFAATVLSSPRSARDQANRAVTLMQDAALERARENADAARELTRAACEHYRRSAEIEPGIAAVRLQHGVCLAALEDYEGAQPELQAAGQLGSTEAWACLYRLHVERARASSATDPALARALLECARARSGAHPAAWGAAASYRGGAPGHRARPPALSGASGRRHAGEAASHRGHPSRQARSPSRIFPLDHSRYTAPPSMCDGTEGDDSA